MATAPGAELIAPSVATLVKQRVTEEGRASAKAAKRAAKRQCSQCGIAETQERSLSCCVKCKSVQYCSKDCQTKHWKEGKHKEACKRLAAERQQTVVLETPDTSFLPEGTSAFTFSTSSFASGSFGEGQEPFKYHKPSFISVGERFYVKVQANAHGSALFIYDKSRECHFYYPSRQRGYTEIFEKVKEEKAFGGKKTYPAVSFEEVVACE